MSAPSTIGPSPNKDLALAEVELMKYQVTHRARLCYMLVGGGVVTLLGGIVMLVAGLAGTQSVWFEYHGLKVTASGFGAVVMAASAAWGLFAWMSRSKTTYKRTVKEEPIRSGGSGRGGGGGRRRFVNDIVGMTHEVGMTTKIER